MPKAYVGLGSNLDDPARQIESAIDAVSHIEGLRLLRRSSLYRSPPMGPSDQPDYCNAVCELACEIAPEMLMQSLLHIEREAGRIRGEHKWGPRRIDLDLLHVEGVALDTPTLRLPHPGIATRSFVLVPLAEIAADQVLPGLGRVADLVQGIDRSDLREWC